MNEQEQFLSDLDTDQTRGVDVLDAPLVAEPEKKDEQAGDDQTGGDDLKGKKDDDDDGDFGGDDLKPRTRRERRLMRKLNDERESSIFLAGKLQAREEAKSSITEESDYLKSVERIYGTETPEAQIATELLKKAIIGARDDAKKQAIEELRAERQKELEETKKAESQLDDIIDELEDEHNFTFNAAQEKAYFDLLRKMSPKDSSGAVVSLADPHAVFEIFQDKLKSSTKGTGTRAKDLSARSMTQSGASSESTLKDDAHTRFLKDNGII